MMLFAGVVLTILGKSTIGTAVIMMDLTIKLSGAVQSIADLFPQRSLSLAIEKRIETMLEEGDSQDTATKLPVESFERMNIHIDGYRFAQAGKTVLKSTDIELTKGDICVIKGTSGGGKSTLAKSHEPPALLVVCCWPYGADVTFPPKGGLTNHCLVTLPPKGGSVSHCLVTGGRLKAALCYLAYSPSIWSRSYCSLMYFLIVSSFTLPTVSQ